jgi:hypothetical protein
MSFPLRKMVAFDSESPLPLVRRGAGTYEVQLQIEGNALLSTVFVSSADPGAYVRVTYSDYTTGSELGEEFPLAEHKDMSAFGTDRVTVARLHNKPKIKAEVFGGEVEFSVYITVIDSTAADLDASLKLDGQDANLLANKAMPMAGYDPSDGKFKMMKMSGGDLRVTSSLGQGGGNVAKTVGTTPVRASVSSDNMLGRKILAVMPKNGTIYWGFSASVNPNTGFPILRGQLFTMQVNHNVDVWLVAEENQSVIMSEAS